MLLPALPEGLSVRSLLLHLNYTFLAPTLRQVLQVLGWLQEEEMSIVELPPV